MTASLVVDARLIGGRSIRKSSRNPASILGAIVFPLLFFALFNIVMRRIMEARDFDYVQLLPSTIVVQAMIFSAMSSAYFVAEDRVTGITGRFRSMPVHPLSPILGRAVADVARAFVSLTVVLTVGIIVGMRFNAGIGWLPVYVVVGLLFALGMALVFGLLGYVVSTPEAAVSAASIPYLPLLMLSSGFVPVEDFPGWLQPFVEWQPVTATIDALRALAGDGDIARDVTVALAWSVGLIVVFGAIATRRVRSVA
ncbi:MAG: ABC transporter permease [Actinomycetota bacterium]